MDGPLNSKCKHGEGLEEKPFRGYNGKVKEDNEHQARRMYLR